MSVLRNNTALKKRKKIIHIATYMVVLFVLLQFTTQHRHGVFTFLCTLRFRIFRPMGLMFQFEKNINPWKTHRPPRVRIGSSIVVEKCYAPND